MQPTTIGRATGACVHPIVEVVIYCRNTIMGLLQLGRFPKKILVRGQ